MEVGFFKCPNGHWTDFLPNFEQRCPVCHEKWDIYLLEPDVIAKVGFFKPHAPVKNCDCSACKIISNTQMGRQK